MGSYYIVRHGETLANKMCIRDRAKTDPEDG